MEVTASISTPGSGLTRLGILELSEDCRLPVDSIVESSHQDRPALIAAWGPVTRQHRERIVRAEWHWTLEQDPNRLLRRLVDSRSQRFAPVTGSPPSLLLAGEHSFITEERMTMSDQQSPTERLQERNETQAQSQRNDQRDDKQDEREDDREDQRDDRN